MESSGESDVLVWAKIKMGVSKASGQEEVEEIWSFDKDR